MAGDSTDTSHGRLRALFEVGACTGLTDGQLLERFATRSGAGAEQAFTALVDRHGPMVFRACRAVLRDDHAAMDAFQAAFLVLARKAGSLWVRDSLGPWLHRVARRTACRARDAAARRRAGEREAAESATHRDQTEDGEALAALLHEELDRLPEPLRAAIVLCHLEGLTCEQAARRLGCPIGTVGSRLSRGRRRLRERLGRRGLDFQGGLAAWGGSRGPIPAGLGGSTVSAAMHFVSTRATTHGAAASLASEVLGIMTSSSRTRIVSLLLAATASTIGLASFVGRSTVVAQAREDAALAPDVASVVVRKGPIRVVVKARGSLEATRKSDLASEVEGLVEITSLIPEGTRVTKGQVVCELDSSGLKGRLMLQELALQKAQAAGEIARLERETAEAALAEYVEGAYPRDHGAAEGEVVLARAAVERAERRLKRAQSARERLGALRPGREGEGTAGDLRAELDLADRADAAEGDLARGRAALENSQAGLAVLEKFTREVTVKRLGVAVAKARGVEEAGRDAVELARSTAAKLSRQIESCRILAPVDGIVTYADEPAQPDGRAAFRLESGAVVRERQRLLSVVDLDAPMRLVARSAEAMVDQLVVGQTAQVQVDAFADETFTAVVETIAPLPASERGDEGRKVYPTVLTFTKSARKLRPGMTARAEILVASFDDVLTVPVRAVHHLEDARRRDDKGRVAVVQAPDGRVVWREVTLGPTDGRVVEVKSGLQVGESVAVGLVPPPDARP